MLMMVGCGLATNQASALAATPNTYTDANGNWMGGTTAQHDAWLKTINPNWVSEAYAESIPADAKGLDSTKDGHPYIDEWMPDKNLQQLIVHDQNLSSPNDITKNLLKDNLIYFYPDVDEEHTNRTYFNQVSNTQSLEGMQYATDITDITASPDQDAAFTSWGLFPNGRLSDISALKSLNKLTSLNIQFDDVYDLSPVVGKKFDVATSMSYNHITDASYLESSKDTLGSSFTFGFQSYKLPTITLNAKVTSYTTPSFVIKNVAGANVPVKPYYAAGDSNPNFNSYAAAYKSTADGGAYSDPAKPQVTWTNLNQNNTIDHGYMTVTWEDPLFGNPSYTYQGWVIQPYQLSDRVGNVNVNFKNGDNNQYIYGQQTLSGNLGESWNLALNGDNSFDLADVDSAQNQTIQSIIDRLKEQYGFNSITVSTPNSGQFADSTPIPTVTYTFSKKVQPTVASPVTVKYVNEDNHSIANNQTINGNVGDPYDASVSPYKVDTITKDNQLYQLDTSQLPTNVKGKLGTNPITVTYTYKKVSTVADDATVIVNYIDAANHTILKSQTISGKVGDSYQADGKYQLSTIVINGDTYNLDNTKLPSNVKGQFTKQTQFINYYYNKKQAPTPPTPINPINPINPVNPVTPTPTTPSGSGSTTTTTTQPASSSGIARKGEAVYSLKKIYLYQNKTFKKADRIVGYAKKPRINRPMFVVTGYAYSNSGRLRYQVRDVNHHSRTAGKKGYITAQWAYVRPVYYRSAHKTLTVINPRGVNEYKNKNLTGKVKNFKQGTQLRVKHFVTHHLTTRYQLTNGHYVTGNRKLVISEKQKQIIKIKAKQTIYRYNTANFNKRTKKIKKGTTLKVKKWEYSHPYSTTTFGAKRYQITGGFVTANPKFVKILK
ncbi:hypothetical protein YK48G_21850 [Lentilactobacillus fungorum]|uniref:MucBP domain-containing protein n=2 Tax=Lentilactobacillus fungorum TaxID=2201250 RepID=A0ABQ3W1Q4_9LACO|nr:hypothetical protein YK48G_21850 [Lentilactobacillus fungorum]